MPLSFKVFDAESGAFTYSGAHDGLLLERYYKLLEERESGRLGTRPCLAALEQMLAEAPDFLEAHAYLAYQWFDQDKPKKALDAAMAGLAIANRLIPEGFHGSIEWGDVNNRAYLRLLHHALTTQVRLHRHKEALALIDIMLARNPNDNQGVRHLLGSEALRTKDYARARAVFEQEADYPPYLYELGLYHIIKSDWVSAATALRRGFVANPYIAEVLCGNPAPAPLAIWHDSDLAEPGVALDYVRTYGVLWRYMDYYVGFARWLFNHPRVMMEHAAILECQAALLWEREVDARTRLVEARDGLVEAIDDRLSVAIVTQRIGRDGRPVWPWM